MILAASNSTSISTTAAAPTAICQVFSNGQVSGNCELLSRYFAPPAWYTSLWQGELGLVIVLGATLGGYVYYNYPFGRFFWKKKGIKAVMHFHGAPGVLGILYPYLDKIFLFISSGSERKKNRIVRLIPAVPDAITHLRQDDGGDSFVLIAGDKGLPVSAELQAWAEKNLNELADSHNWNQFALKTKYDMLAKARAEASLFPKIQDWNPGTETVTLLKAGGEIEQKPAIQCTAEEKTWYLKASEQAAGFLAESQEQEAKILAIMNGEESYNYDGHTVALPARKKTEFVAKITEELANAKDEVGKALIGGWIVTLQYVANVLSNVPDGVYFDGAKAEVEDKVRKEIKKKGDDMIKLAIAAVIVIGGIGVVLLVLSKQLG